MKIIGNSELNRVILGGCARKAAFGADGMLKKGGPLPKKVLVFRGLVLKYSETFIRDQILACRRWQPVLIGFHDAGELALTGLDVRLLRDGRRQRNFWSKVQWRLMDKYRWPPLEAVQTLKKEKASLAHVHFGPEAVVFYPIIRALGLPIAITLHGYDINCPRDWWEKNGDAFTAKYPRRLLAIAANPNVHFIAVSEAIREAAVAYGLRRERIEVKYIGVDRTRFRPGRPVTERSQRILYVGRMVEKKGPQYLIRAFARVRKQLPTAELVMIGDGYLMETCENLARELNVPVNFTGSLSHEKVKEHLDAARVLCLPSVTAENGDAEGLPIVLLEAQACGVPVVTSARGGATEGILHGETGFAFPEKDVAALVHYLVPLLENDTLARGMSQKGPDFIAHKFDLVTCTQALENFYDRLASAD